MLKSLSTYLMTRGVLALIVGIIAVAWPGVTVYALVILFAVYAFIDAILQAARAFSGLRAGAVVGRLLLALVGVLELFAAFGAGEAAGTRAWFVVAGLVSIAFGVVLAARPDAGAISLAIIYGIFSLMFGIAQIVLGVQARRGSTARADRLAPA
jgi:uncharacterized membrane protein HdeD (DUF308 family)